MISIFRERTGSSAGPRSTAPEVEWPHVLAFSAIILTVGFAVTQFAQFVGGRVAFRASLVVAAGAVLSSSANVLEDGLRMEWAFFGFVLGTLIILLGLLALTIAIVLADANATWHWFRSGRWLGSCSS